MTKSFTLGTIAFAFILFFAFAFKSADNEKKEYVTIYYNDNYEVASLSYSNGTFKTVTPEKSQGRGDQTPVLKLINELETQGYKLVNYDGEIGINHTKQITTVLLSK